MFINSPLQQFLKSAMGYLIPTLAFIYFTWVLLFLPIICGPKIYSPYNEFDEKLNDKIEQDKNLQRKSGANEYLKRIDQRTSRNYYTTLFKGNVEHLFLVITQGPTSKSYLLTQLVTQLDKEFRDMDNDRNAMLICDRRNLKDSELLSLAQYYPVVKPNVTETKYGWKNQQEIKKTNFVNCVELGLAKTNPDYVTVLWDSIVPYDKFIPYLNYIIKTKMEFHFVRGELQKRTDQWLFLHLHEPLSMRDFDASLSSFQELLLVAFLGGGLFYLTAHILNPGATNLNGSSKIILTIYGSIVFVTLALSNGRPYLTELRWILPDFLKVNEFFEVIPITSVTLPFNSVLKMLSYLKELRCSPYVTFHDAWDHAIGTFEIPAYVVSPSLVKYVNS